MCPSLSLKVHSYPGAAPPFMAPEGQGRREMTERYLFWGHLFYKTWWPCPSHLSGSESLGEAQSNRGPHIMLIVQPNPPGWLGRSWRAMAALSSSAWLHPPTRLLWGLLPSSPVLTFPLIPLPLPPAHAQHSTLLLNIFSSPLPSSIFKIRFPLLYRESYSLRDLPPSPTESFIDVLWPWPHGPLAQKQAKSWPDRVSGH